MPTFRLGAKGRDVVQIQERLRALGHYTGRLDGVYGGGTESAVLAFQNEAQLGRDGVVSPTTWARLFAVEPPQVSEHQGRPLLERCLLLTAAFETGAPPPECYAVVAGDFDGQGISFGALQFSLGPGRLGELLQRLDARDPSVLDDMFHRHADVLRAAIREDREGRLAWARTLQHPLTHRIHEPWRGMFRALGRRRECQLAQAELAEHTFQRALALAREYGLWSERAAALMFDIVVQNGSISALVKAQIFSDFSRVQESDRAAMELAKLRIVALRRAAVVRPEWVHNVRVRKLTLAEGRGAVHGHEYDLAEDYGIRMVDAGLTLA